MNTVEYQKWTETTAIYPGSRHSFNGEDNSEGVVYCALGLAEEAGEALGKIKKSIRKLGIHSVSKKKSSQEFRDLVRDELGDVMWYVARLSDELGIGLDAIVARNVEKLSDRKDRGVLHGNGDSR